MRATSCLSIALLLGAAASAFGQQRQQAAASASITPLELQRAHLMLRQAHDELRKNYYDPAFHGVDIDKTYQQFDARLDASKSISETYRVIAAYLLNLHDSHVFFLPPTRQNRATPGFYMQMIGDKCLITRVQPGTDAANKLHVGDQVLALDGYKVTRDHFAEEQYFIQVLSPAPSETLDLVSPTGVQRKETVAEKLVMGKAILDLTDESNNADYWALVREEEEGLYLSRSRYFELGDTLVWNMPEFNVDPMDLEKIFSKASKKKNLILDLRGNPGGYEEYLRNDLGHFFDHAVKIGDVSGRAINKPLMTKPRGPQFNGNLIVLIDHNSASSAELFAKVIQLEHRGKVIGDHSAGAVMQAREFTEETGTDYKVYYDFSITSASIVMTDGKSLENVGVTPDELVLPTADDLAAGRDPVLARAAELVGEKLDPVEAGRHFPYEWPKQ
jgi:C-terminal processing protease CtpA/Prc